MGVEQRRVERATHVLLAITLLLCIVLPLLGLAWLAGAL